MFQLVVIFFVIAHYCFHCFSTLPTRIINELPVRSHNKQDDDTYRTNNHTKKYDDQLYAGNNGYNNNHQQEFSLNKENNGDCNIDSYECDFELDESAAEVSFENW